VNSGVFEIKNVYILVLESLPVVSSCQM